MGDRLKDRVAIVTGAGRGIGRGIAILMAEEGAKVVVNDLGGAADGTGAEKKVADEVVAEIKAAGGEAVANYDSVTTVEGGESIIQTAINSFGKLDILVNNAGILRDRMIFNMAPEEWDAVIKVHLYGVFNCTKPACVLFRQQRSGRVISMSSTSGLIGNSGQANYGAAKAGIAGFTRVIARDMGRYGVTCNAIAPGASTRMTMSEEVLAARQIRASKGVTGGGGAQSPVGAPALRDPDDIAPIVVYLATDAAANINGQTFGSSGGTISLYHNPEPMKSIHKDGRWTLDELDSIMPGTLLAGLVNPSPPQAPKQ
ncbi:MAG: SDR family oxidoreductase [Dehalococcoidales bacterium]|nr:SDR family oxidoreductase [Dehalococcoidales bacterium]